MIRYLLFSLTVITTVVHGQTLNDGLMMPRNNFCTGFTYSQDKWTEYWEGTLKRENGNIGSLRTTSLMWVGNYGITDKLNIIAMVPYIKTEATQGTLHPMQGVQDLTLGAKYNFLKKQIGASSFRTFGVIGFSTPLTDYSPDYFPLSIGTHTTNVFYRLTAYNKFINGFYVNASAGYTWRSNTHLDRSAYYTKDRLYLTNEVEMPNVFDYNLSVGYLNRGFQGDLFYQQFNTLGGGDIRRQDAPFVSNRMNASKVGALIMYYLPQPRGLALRASYSITVAGRNVGDANNWMTGILYTINFSRKKDVQVVE